MTPLTLECDVHFERRRRGKREIEAGPEPAVPEPGRVPRLARLMALAIRFDRLVRESKVADYVELARLSHVTPARITQIMNLLNLAPDLQEVILFLPRTLHGRDPVHLRQLQPIARVLDWRKQRALWKQLAEELARS